MQAMLQTLEQENVFLIPLDNRRETYRYHHLFADLLRSRLTQQLPETVAAVHQRASDWFATHDRLDAAIQHRHWVCNMGFEQNQEMSENSALKDQFDCGEKAHESRFVQTPVPSMLHG
jgi:hypothetical protein